MPSGNQRQVVTSPAHPSATTARSSWTSVFVHVLPCSRCTGRPGASRPRTAASASQSASVTSVPLVIRAVPIGADGA